MEISIKTACELKNNRTADSTGGGCIFGGHFNAYRYPQSHNIIILNGDGKKKFTSFNAPPSVVLRTNGFDAPSCT